MQKLGTAIAKDLAEALIDLEPSAVGPNVGDADGGVLECTAPPPLAFAQRILNLLAFGYESTFSF